MSVLNLLRDRHGLNLSDTELQSIVNTCAEIIVVQDQEDYEQQSRAAMDEHGCSICGDLDGFSCICDDEYNEYEEEDYCSYCGEKTYGLMAIVNSAI